MAIYICKTYLTRDHKKSWFLSLFCFGLYVPPKSTNFINFFLLTKTTRPRTHLLYERNLTLFTLWTVFVVRFEKKKSEIRVADGPIGEEFFPIACMRQQCMNSRKKVIIIVRIKCVPLAIAMIAWRKFLSNQYTNRKFYNTWEFLGNQYQ